MSVSVLNYACECPIIHRIMLVKILTYNSQYYASILGSGQLNQKLDSTLHASHNQCYDDCTV